MKHQRPFHRRGFMFAEAMLGMALMIVLAAALLTVKSGYLRVERRLSEQRAADRLAEATLVDLQRGRPAQAGATLVDLETPAPRGWRWVSVEQTYNGRVGRISGLVRAAP